MKENSLPGLLLLMPTRRAFSRKKGLASVKVRSNNFANTISSPVKCLVSFYRRTEMICGALLHVVADINLVIKGDEVQNNEYLERCVVWYMKINRACWPQGKSKS